MTMVKRYTFVPPTEGKNCARHLSSCFARGPKCPYLAEGRENDIC